MVSIKNDAFVVGTAAASAAAANVAAQNVVAIKAAAGKVSTPVADAFAKTATTLGSKQTYSDAIKATADFAKKEFNATKSFLHYLRGLKAEAIMKEANEAKAAILAKNSAFAAPEAAEYFARNGITFPAKPVAEGFIGTVKKGLRSLGDKIGTAFGAAKEGIRNFGKKAVDGDTYKNLFESAKAKTISVKDGVKNNGFVKGTNWKTVGKYAAVAAAVALTAVIAKRIYNAVTNKD